MKQKKALQARNFITLTAVWGNGDASSTIKVSHRRWRQIQEGAKHHASAWSWYEGKRYSVSWSFSDATFSVSGADGMECVVDSPLSELTVEEC